MPKQSIKNNTKCKFSFEGLESECWELREDYIEGTQLSEKEFSSLEGEICTVLDLETATEFGDKDFEYYNISFDKFPNTILIGMSGYHLTII